MRLAGEALLMARESRDPGALGLVLPGVGRSWMARGPIIDEMEALTEEAEAVARDAGDPCALGPRSDRQGAPGRVRGTAPRSRPTSMRRRASSTACGARCSTGSSRNQAAAVAAYPGELDRAEQLATESVELGRLAHHDRRPDHGLFGGLLYQIRMAQGRVDELVPLLEGASKGAPDVPSGASPSRAHCPRAIASTKRGCTTSGWPKTVRERAPRHRVHGDDLRTRPPGVPAAPPGNDHPRRLRPPVAVHG